MGAEMSGEPGWAPQLARCSPTHMAICPPWFLEEQEGGYSGTGPVQGAGKAAVSKQQGGPYPGSPPCLDILEERAQECRV